MQTKKLIYILLLVVIGVAAILLLVTQRTRKTQTEERAEQIILEYIEAKGLDIQPGTEEYRLLMKGILLGEHPDLTGENSVYTRNEAERDYIIDYAARHVDLGNQADYNELDLEEAETETDPNK
jgi:hypothetical protein